MVGYKYRCAYSGNNTSSFSPEFILRYTVLWTGQVSTAWELAGNWNCAVLPDDNTDVIIKAGAPNFPVINSSSSCRSLSADQGTSIRVKTGANISVKGK